MITYNQEMESIVIYFQKLDIAKKNKMDKNEIRN